MDKERTKRIFEHDLALMSDEVQLIAGIDEVGRGPLAGPVVTACVVMDYTEMIDGVFDSKALSLKKRETLYDEIFRHAKSISISLRDNRVIDEINILNATKEAMRECYVNSTVKPDILLVDAVKLDVSPREMAIIKGDATSYAIACASIIAKVYRDRLMAEYALSYDKYDFEHNVGYGTKKHIEGLRTYGICPIHRMTFIKNIIGESCNHIYTASPAK